MKRWIWMSMPALMLSAPAWSWCVDHDADDAKYCKEHPGRSAMATGTIRILPPAKAATRTEARALLPAGFRRRDRC
jgi:hypothetical protein